MLAVVFAVSGATVSATGALPAACAFATEMVTPSMSLKVLLGL